ncbi:metallophosphatase family protein [bacterium]|nr:metallophosphatase family protein [bacterium]
MRTLIISDVHANRTALQAVLEDAAPFDRVWCLGDVVGYGPDPNECIEKIRDLPGIQCVRGNHDAAILGEIDVAAFNFEARASLEWLEEELRPENRAWLDDRPERMTIESFTLVHGSPRSPVWEYVMDITTALDNKSQFDTPYCLIGHTHIPSVFTLDRTVNDTPHLYMMPPAEPFSLDQKSIINPGSVGQPRDHNPLSSYLMYDDSLELPFEYHRVAYDVEKVQHRILAAGLPHRHATRLQDGW